LEHIKKKDKSINTWKLSVLYIKNTKIMNKFSEYNSTDFLNDDTFIRWILKTDTTSVNFWEEYFKNNPAQQKEINEAVEIFNHFGIQQNQLTNEEIFLMWDRIKHNSFKKKQLGVFNLLKYAALIIVVFISGALSYYFYQESKTREFQITGGTPLINTDEAQIILSDGRSVPLDQKDSEIKYNSTGDKIIVNNDTLVQEVTNNKTEMNRIVMPYGKSSLITLSDGTKIWLNAGSQLMYPSTFDRKIREVLLFGEAFFEVAHNEKNPFIVRTDYIDIEVLGTSFDVSAYADDKNFETILVNGKVSLKVKKEGFFAGKEKFYLEPNQRFQINKVEGVGRVSEVDVSVYTSWKDGMLKFEKEDLINVLRKLERYYNNTIQIKDPLLGSHKISGKLDLKNSLSEVLDVIQLTVPIDWGKQKNGNYFIIESKK